MGEQLKLDEDRREYFRIDDSLRVTYRVVAKSDVPRLAAALEKGHGEGFTLMADLHAINHHLSAVLRRVESSQPDVATYLKALDNKIEMLARNFFSRESELSTLPARPANISGGGMAVRCKELIESGKQLEIKVLLASSFTGIVIYGEVIGCDLEPGSDEYPYIMRIHFTHIRPVDRDALVKHVLAKQSEDLRRRRAGD